MRFTLIGAYEYDNGLFDDIDLPTDSVMDRQDLVNYILRNYGEMEVLYSNIPFMKDQVIHWWYTIADRVNRMSIALSSEYDVLNSYYRNYTLGKTNANTRTDDTEENTNQNYTNNGTASDNEKYAPYDTSSVNTRSVNDNTHADTNVTESSKTNTGTVANNGTENIVYESKGNLGLKTPADIITKEIELAKFNYYDWVAKQFAQEFLVAIY